MVPIVYVEDLLMTFNIFPGLASAFYVSFIVAGFTEEFFKRFSSYEIVQESALFRKVRWHSVQCYGCWDLLL